MPDMDFARDYATVIDLGSVKYQQDGMYFRQDGSLFDGDPETGRETSPQPPKIVSKPTKLTLPKGAGSALSEIYGEAAA